MKWITFVILMTDKSLRIRIQFIRIVYVNKLECHIYFQIMKRITFFFVNMSDKQSKLVLCIEKYYHQQQKATFDWKLYQ